MNSIIVSGFDWDEGNWPKCGKHGVSKAEIEAIFHNVPAIFEHPDHSRDEQRLRAIGKTANGRHVYVSFTIREVAGNELIRPVSARFMHKREIERYEQE